MQQRVAQPTALGRRAKEHKRERVAGAALVELANRENEEKSETEGESGEKERIERRFENEELKMKIE